MARHIRTDISSYTFDEYDFSGDGDAAPSKRFRPGGAVFKVVDEYLRMIHSYTLRVLGERGVKDVGFVSKMEVLCAIFWVYITRARFRRLSPEEETSFTVAFPGRRWLDPEFPPTAWGNVCTRTVARTTVADVVRLEVDGKLPVDPEVISDAIVGAAVLINRALRRPTVERDFLPARIALADRLRDPATEAEAFQRATRPDHAGLHCNLWTHVGADLDFRIPGTNGTADSIRETFSPKEGTMNIMPRTDAGGADWEVSLALRLTDLKRFHRRLKWDFEELLGYSGEESTGTECA